MKKSIILALLAGATCLVSCNSSDDDNNRVSPVVLNASDAQLFNKELPKFKATEGFERASGHVALAADINSAKDSLLAEGLVGLFTDLAPFVGQAEQFKDWLSHSKEIEVEVAVEGKAGRLGKSIVNAKGVETFMLYKKGITGGLQIHNITERIKRIKQGENIQNNLNEVIGFLFGVDNFSVATNSKGKYQLIIDGNEKARSKNELLRYINQVSENEKTPVLTDVVLAVNTASANINDKKKLNQSLDIISESVAKILALRAVHYFDEFVDDLSSDDKRVTAVHEMSEGLGFVYGLQFTYNPETGKPYFSNEEVTKYVNSINFWKAQEAKTKLDEIANELAKRLKFNRKDA